MAPPDPHNGARPGGGTGARLESGRAALESEAHRTAGLLTGTAPAAIDPSGVAVLDVELLELIGTPAGPVADVEAVALGLVDTFGPTWCRRLAAELGEVVDDLLAERRTVWGGAGR